MNACLTETAAECDLSLFVACYNEEEGILPTLNTVLAALQEVGCTYDIVIVDDASQDRSVPLIEQFMEEHPEVPITLVVNEFNQGLGVNYVEAAFRGRGRYYRAICGDDVESKETLISVFRRLGEADIILTYHADASARTWLRRMISRTYTGLVNLLSGCRIRYYNGLAVLPRYDVMRWHPNSPGFGFQADLVTRLLYMGATSLEIPVIPKERGNGKSNALKFKNLCSVAHSLLEIFIRRLGRIMDNSKYEKLRRNHPQLTQSCSQER
ncbi:MAG: glycosyltransferase family 2 protein [Thermoguttaceae bacterium]